PNGGTRTRKPVGELQLLTLQQPRSITKRLHHSTGLDLSGVVEEMFYRRIVMDGLASAGTSLLAQIVISAVVFAAVHSVWALFSKSWRIVLPVVGSTATLGVLLALVYVASDRVVFPAVLAHIAINLVIEPGLLYSAAKVAVQGNHRKANSPPSLIAPK
ncbi:CPBP family intramembrane glutamic endopeptidase, partial [Arthrobacter sp. TMN-49]